MLLTKEQILSAEDRKTKEVEVPEWGGNVLISELTAEDRDRFEAEFVDSKSKKGENPLFNIRARLAALTIVDENGNRLFNDADIKALGKKSGSCLDKIFAVAQKINGIGNNDIEEIAKN